MTTKKAVAVKEEQEQELILTQDRPDFVKDTGRGNEDVTVDDLSIPRLDVIQSLSPQRKKNDPAYIEGAEEGMLFNSVTGVLYGTEVMFVPAFFRMEYVIWKARQEGGGFCGAFPSQAEAREEMDRNEWTGLTFKDKSAVIPTYEIVDTAQHFGLIVHGPSKIEEVVISMSKSKMKASRQLNTLCKMAGGDRFASAYIVKSTEVNGDKGDYYSIAVKRAGWSTEDIYLVGEALYEAVSGGERNVNWVEEETSEADSEGEVGGEDKY